ncbi:MAG: sugar ABC transporter permease [Bacilli bacterium]|jgi:multiple sugar transport system permease protein|nr:sugar ABC transporter permease [Bacilli bacterium]
MEQTLNTQGKDNKVVAANDFFAARPDYQPGYDAKNDTIIRLVSPKKKNAKPYRVTGIDDVASKNNWKGWLYLAPALILVVIFLVYPLINTITIAFQKNYSYLNGTSEGFTFDNFGQILTLTSYNGAWETPFVQYAIPNTFIIVFITVPVSTLLALLISVALNSIKWFQKALQTIFFLPYVTNTIAVGMVFSVIFADNGIINYIFPTNPPTMWIYGAQQWRAFVPLCLYIVWSSLPFKILIFLSGLQGIDKQYYQAAQIDAASKQKTLWKITVPLMSPQILYIVVTSFIGAFKEYTAIVGLFNGPGTALGSKNMYTIVYYIYDNLSNHTSFAAAAAVFLFVIILVFTWLQMIVSKKRVYY